MLSFLLFLPIQTRKREQYLLKKDGYMAGQPIDTRPLHTLLPPEREDA
jgi:hypothetical protein